MSKRWVVSLGSRYLGTVTAGSEQEARELGTSLLQGGEMAKALTVELTVDNRGLEMGRWQDVGTLSLK